MNELSFSPMIQELRFKCVCDSNFALPNACLGNYFEQYLKLGKVGEIKVYKPLHL